MSNPNRGSAKKTFFSVVAPIICACILVVVYGTQLTGGSIPLKISAGDCFNFIAGNYVAKADAYAMKQQYDEAIDNYTKAIDKGRFSDSELSKIYHNRGVMRYEKSLYDEALQDLNKAIEFDSSNIKSYDLRGHICSMRGFYDLAVEDYSRVIELDRANGAAYFKRGHAYHSKGDSKQGIEDVDKVIGMGMSDGGTFLARGEMYFDEGFYDRAIEDMTKVIEMGRADRGIYVLRGTALAAKNRCGQAIKDFDKAIASYAGDMNAHYGKAACYSLTKNTRRACESLKASIDAGYSDYEHIRSDHDLNGIRRSACYRKIMAGR